MTGEERLEEELENGAGCILICFSARDKVVSSPVSTTKCCFGKKKETVGFLLKNLWFCFHSRVWMRCTCKVYKPGYLQCISFISLLGK